MWAGSILFLLKLFNQVAVGLRTRPSHKEILHPFEETSPPNEIHH